MIRVQWNEPDNVTDVQGLVQSAIDIEFATLPPYLYARLTILPDTNAAAASRVQSIIGQEMIHMCLACNIMNAIGGSPAINPPHYPGTLPHDVGGGLELHLLPFSEAAMQQGMAIEEPSTPIDPPSMKLAAEPGITIGEYYERLKLALKSLPTSAWTPNRNQIDDSQFFQGQIFAVNDYGDACRAIDNIVSEGEGTPVSPGTTGSPLDFQNDLAHYYRFWEVAKNQVLMKAPNPVGYAWGPPLGVDWHAVYPAIADPELHDFAQDPVDAQAAQMACNTAYSAMVDALVGAFNGKLGGLGEAVRAMFDLRMAAIKALNTPLADGRSVAGPAFVYLDQNKGAAA
ncbi:MAG: ferritin-like protein [Sphingomonas sp.]|uniref:ferritin-like domain-containing protein n=1 Tax=Sphingomonas sp. TaxID=28214 RepID=UPI0035A9A1F4|nr:ferritin-like protein [Sphingomonas sp.]